jgi:hypothetical protein
VSTLATVVFLSSLQIMRSKETVTLYPGQQIVCLKWHPPIRMSGDNTGVFNCLIGMGEPVSGTNETGHAPIRHVPRQTK